MALPAFTFDTHKFVCKLKGAGFNDQQAEALTDAVQESQASLNVATKQDVVDVRRDVEQGFADVRRDLADAEERTDAKLDKLGTELRHEIESLRKDIDAKHESLRKDIDTKLANMKFDLLRWFFGIALAQTGLLVALKLWLRFTLHPPRNTFFCGHHLCSCVAQSFAARRLENLTLRNVRSVSACLNRAPPAFSNCSTFQYPSISLKASSNLSTGSSPRFLLIG